MVVRRASAVWDGDLKHGDGQMRFGSGAFEGAFTFASRFERGPGTNPEELLGAAQAGCFSMALSGALVEAGYAPQHIATEAQVYLDASGTRPTITRIDLATTIVIADIEEAELREIAEAVKEECPVSRALTGITRSLAVELQRP